MIKMTGKEIKKRWARTLPELKDLDNETEYEFENMGDLIEIVKPEGDNGFSWLKKKLERK